MGKSTLRSIDLLLERIIEHFGLSSFPLSRSIEMYRSLSLLAGLVLCCLVFGCNRSSGEKLYRVHGTVVFEGKPVPKGTLFFDPDGSKGGSGSQGFADIIDGKYDSAASGQGIKKGPYVVRVQGFDGKAGNELPYGNPLFLEHEVKKDFPGEDLEWTIDVDAKPLKR